MDDIVARTFVRSGMSPLSMPTFCKKKYVQLCQFNMSVVFTLKSYV